MATTKKTQLKRYNGTDWDIIHPETEASQVTGLATVATSGSYNDLSNKPTIDNNNQKVQVISGTTTTSFGANDSVSFVAGSNVIITPDTTNKKITIASTNTTYNTATTTANGLMSSTDKSKLDGIANNATNVTSSTVSGWGYTKNAGTITGIKMNGSSKGTSGVVDLGTVATTDTKNTAGSTDSSSKLFIIGATSQTASSQTYSQDTAYIGTDGCLYSNNTKVLTSHQDISGKLDKSNVVSKGSATQPIYFNSSGVATACTYQLNKTVPSDAKFTDTVYTLPTATSSALGGVKSSTTGTTANRNYNVEVNSDGTMKVNVPWTDNNTNTSHSHSAGVGLVGSGNAGTSSGTYTYKVALVDDTLDSNASLSRPSADSNRTYPVIADKNGKLATIVPWTNSTYTFSANNPTLAWSTTSTIGTAGGTTYKVTMPANPNTWRGIQNNLTSTSTTDSLSAYQGKLLNDGKADKATTFSGYGIEDIYIKNYTSYSTLGYTINLGESTVDIPIKYYEGTNYGKCWAIDSPVDNTYSIQIGENGFTVDSGNTDHANVNVLQVTSSTFRYIEAYDVLHTGNVKTVGGQSINGTGDIPIPTTTTTTIYSGSTTLNVSTTASTTASGSVSLTQTPTNGSKLKITCISTNTTYAAYNTFVTELLVVKSGSTTCGYSQAIGIIGTSAWEGFISFRLANSTLIYATKCWSNASSAPAGLRAFTLTKVEMIV